MAGARTEIPGSTVKRSAAARLERLADPNQVIEATIVIRRPAVTPGSGQTRAEIEKSLSADEADVSAITNFAQHHGLTIEEVSPAKRIVRIKGTVRDMNLAFGIDLAYFAGEGGSFLSYDGPLTVPSDLSGKITAVLGLEQRPVAKPRT
ncbi:MAG TPA: protease pro-enzyme activation domain-containing protein [Bryobacteraceae bacterium]|nr:protease pro-enzyme activation domain-containing protein [Bryobacteraceae bacterium]